MMQTSRPGVGVTVIIWREGSFLMYQRAGSHGEGTWSVPGGHLEWGESFAACAAREVMEEVGISIKNIALLAVTNDIFTHENKHYVTIWTTADWESGEPIAAEPDKVHNLRWVTFKTLPSPLFEPCWQHLRHAKPELFQ
ncbi:MAG TPA: NUDIX domain-containing protein [Candidatus Saccharimonadales bacterium]|nr:NUDIX domain-containing protein [Candidatus Saccharimonadales bacterium]